MPESIVQVTSGVGPKLHTWQRTIGANNVEDEFTLPGEYPLPSYSVTFQTISTATGSSHVVQLMAGASLKVRVRRIALWQESNATAVSVTRFLVLRLTTAGTGGTSVTPAPYDTTSGASGATAMTLPASKGTEAATLLPMPLVLRQATLATASQAEYPGWQWQQLPGTAPLIIPAGAANGIAIKTGGAVAGATVTGYIEFVESSF